MQTLSVMVAAADEEPPLAAAATTDEEEPPPRELCQHGRQRSKCKEQDGDILVHGLYFDDRCRSGPWTEHVLCGANYASGTLYARSVYNDALMPMEKHRLFQTCSNIFHMNSMVSTEPVWI